MENQSLGIVASHHSVSLVMPNGGPWDGYVYPTLTVVIDSYIKYLYRQAAKPQISTRIHTDSPEKLHRQKHSE